MADPICRWRNTTVKQVCEFTHILPHKTMLKAEAREYIENRWNQWDGSNSFFRTAYQLAAQLGLYYEDENKFYPRFDHVANVDEAELYIREWIKRYYVPNPYTSSIKYNGTPIIINVALANALNESPNGIALNEFFERKLNIQLGNADIIANMFERFSCFKEEDGLIKFSNDGLNTGNELCSNSPVDKKAFFDTFGRIVRDDREYTNFSPSLLPTLAAIRTKPFLLLAGISGTGKSRIVRRLAQASTTAALEGLDVETLENRRFDIHSPANFQLIQVKPNWHNSMEVVGYQTNIPQPRYVFTPFVEFVAKAWQHPDVPFFLCLDEMNLAPVEEYFAEFLSAIESRSKNADGLFSTDPIVKPFDNFGAAVCEQMIVDLFPGKNVANAAEEPLRSIIVRFKTKGLSLPENLIVIGTVNMDETTFSFSRKVLDRAMSFEMNEVDFDSLLQGQADVVNAPLPTALLNLLTNRPVDAAEVTELIDAERIVNYLKALNQVLGGTPFKLGYRAANECLLYVAAAKDLGRDDATAALDEFTLMKVLSRIEGDTTKLQADGDGTLLSRLKTVIEAQLGTPAKPNGSDSDEVEETDATPEEKPQLQCVAKLERMMLQLQRNSFVSYWE